MVIFRSDGMVIFFFARTIGINGFSIAFNGFGVIQPLDSMVFNGHGLLIQQCDGFYGSFTSKVSQRLKF